MAYKKIALVLGSETDLPVAEKAFAVLKRFNINYEARVLSAHRTPAELAAFAASSRENGFGVVIAFAGMAAHLAGAIAAHTTLPVIAVPCGGGVGDGLDALLSSVQMPPGVPVATVAVNGGVNAALLAVQILAAASPFAQEPEGEAASAGASAGALAASLAAYKQELCRSVLDKDARLHSASPQSTV